MTDLFDAIIEEKANEKALILVETQVKELLSQPEKVLELWQKDHQKQRAEIARLKPAAEKYRQFLDSDGYIDSAEAASLLHIEYIQPNGKPSFMGRNYFLQLLELDRIILNTVNGYRFTSKAEKRGLGITRVVTRNNQVKSLCLFTPEGIDRIINKYQNDERVFYSTASHELYWEGM